MFESKSLLPLFQGRLLVREVCVLQRSAENGHAQCSTSNPNATGWKDFPSLSTADDADLLPRVRDQIGSAQIKSEADVNIVDLAEKKGGQNHIMNTKARSQMIADVTKRLSLMWGTVDGSGDGRSRLWKFIEKSMWVGSSKFAKLGYCDDERSASTYLMNMQKLRAHGVPIREYEAALQ
ncbi:hypothetical protein RB195_000680 [Necator americanus]|uniref:Uncharacterized protein n=1 Tax=Necator americanus TaxID=51031 RepID=A0ABR1DAV9_NECAM